MSSVHRLAATPETVKVGVIDAAHPPVLTVTSGDEVELETWSHWGGKVLPGMSLDEVVALRAGHPIGPHSITGPIDVAGARPGDVLRVDVVELVPGEWGFNLALPAPLGRGVLAGRFPAGAVRHLRHDRSTMTTELVPGVRLPLRPFLGIMGVAPAEPGPHSSVVPGAFGGNLDLRDLAVGSSLHLPVFQAGCGFYAGDGHACQGDGEVNQTAIETSMDRARLRLTCLAASDHPVWSSLPALPWAETPSDLVALGLDEDLDAAVTQAVDALVSHLVVRFGLEPADAYALSSLAADVGATQVVNRTKGAHARLPWSTLGRSGPLVDGIGRSSS
jgi:acetamidase/formamidase